MKKSDFASEQEIIQFQKVLGFCLIHLFRFDPRPIVFEFPLVQ